MVQPGNPTRNTVIRGSIETLFNQEPEKKVLASNHDFVLISIATKMFSIYIKYTLHIIRSADGFKCAVVGLAC